MKEKLIGINFILLLILHILNQTIIVLPVYIFIPFYIIMFYLTDKKNIFGVYLGLLLMSSDILLYVLNVIFILTLIIKYRNHLSKAYSNVFILCLILMESVHVLLNSMLGYEDNIFKLLGFSLCLIPFIFIRQIEKEIDIKKTFNYLLVGFIFYSVITICTYTVHYNIFNFFEEVRRFGYLYRLDNRFALIENPNTLGKYSAFIISCYIVLIYLGTLKRNLINSTLIIFVGIIGALTLSKSFLLMLLVMFLIYLLMLALERRFLNLFVSVISIMMVYTIIHLGFDKLIQEISVRLNETDDISSGRLYIYEQYINYILNRDGVLIYGIGLQDYLEKLRLFDSSFNQSSHNLIIEIIISWGLIGMILIGTYLIIYLLGSTNFIHSNLMEKVIRLLPFISLVIAAMFSQFFASYYHTFGITLFSLIILNVNYKSDFIFKNGVKYK